MRSRPEARSWNSDSGLAMFSHSASSFERLMGDLRQKPILLGALLVLATLLLYGRVTHHEFVWDDSAYVTKNIHVSTGLNLGNVVWAFTSFHQGNWHPLTWISHMADCQLFGLNSGPHHFVNVALHAANVLLLFFVLHRATGALWRSFPVAALFAVHPLNVETVARVSRSSCHANRLKWARTGPCPCDLRHVIE